VRVEEEAIHDTPTANSCHSRDQFDGIVRARWLAILGDWAYATALHQHDVQLGPAQLACRIFAVGLPEVRGQERGSSSTP
jgi:hypothetical protein